jgi:transcription initiation factor TFIID subunit 12
LALPNQLPGQPQATFYANAILAHYQQIVAGQQARPLLPQQQQQQARPGFPSNDDRRLLSKRGIQKAMRAAGLEGTFTLDADAEKALSDFYESFVENALSFGCEVAKKRRSQVLQARDISVHLERQWNIYVPGFEDTQLRPYRRPQPSEAHRQRQLAVRRSLAEMEAPSEN